MSTSTSAPSSKPLKRLSLLQSPTTLTFDATSAADALPSPASPPTHKNNLPNLKNARRQSSIYYVPSDSIDSALPENETARSIRRYSALQSQSAVVGTDANSERSKRQSVSLTETPSPAALTLVEKHADLLRFIAQKESRCSELRAQLATQETELLALKRKWERIVRRGFDAGSASSMNIASSSLAGNGDAAALLSGLREGVQGVGRLLAQLGVGESQIIEEPSLARIKDLGHASASSVSTRTSSSASARLSQSSMSSVDVSEEEQVLVSSKPVLHDLSTSTPTRRKPYEPSSPQSGLPPTPLSGPTSPGPSPHLSSRSSSQSGTNTNEPTPKASNSLRRTSSTNSTSTSNRKRASRPPSLVAMPPLIPVAVNPPSGAFPTGVVSLPGASAGAAAAAAWVGRRISARTSMLLSDAFAALASPTTPSASGVAETGTITSRDAKSSPILAAQQAPSPSLIDDNEEDGQDVEFGEWTATLAPEKLPSTPASGSPAPSQKNGKSSDGKAKDVDADGEEWNW